MLRKKLALNLRYLWNLTIQLFKRNEAERRREDEIERRELADEEEEKQKMEEEYRNIKQIQAEAIRQNQEAADEVVKKAEYTPTPRFMPRQSAVRTNANEKKANRIRHRF